MKQWIGHIATTRRRGSALILTVVLTCLLAIVGVLFVMASRIDKLSTTATTESRELTCAVDTVLAQIEQALIADVPGATGNQEYYDFPDDLNPWLADLEPYASEGKYYWRQVSNLVGSSMVRSRNLRVQVVGERKAIDPNLKNDSDVTTADADGDGAGDARWFEVPGVMTSKGKPFYAAVRIVDNGGMLNVNTGFQADPNGAGVDGANQLQVNLLSLAAPPGVQPRAKDANSLLAVRANNGANAAAMADLDAYAKDVIWQYMDVKNPSLNNPSPYTPFDLSDELELATVSCSIHRQTDTRIEDWGRFRVDTLSMPLEYGGGNLDDWYRRVAGGVGDAFYSYRHIATTYNMDRILTPKPLELASWPRKMVNVNTSDQQMLQTAIVAALAEATPDANAMEIAQQAAQITANLCDYIDDDDEVTAIPSVSSSFYGFERPCVYISEVACRQTTDAMGNVHSSYAIELYRPYFEDSDPNATDWQLVIDNQSKSDAGDSKPDVEVSITWSGSRRFHVILAEDLQAPLAEEFVRFLDPNEPTDTVSLYGYDRADYAGTPQRLDPSIFAFDVNAVISLRRAVPGTTRPLTADRVNVPGGWMEIDNVARSLQRDISTHRCLRRLWSPATQPSTPALGNAGSNYVDPNESEPLQAHPSNKPLTNIGELGMIFRKSVYSMAPDSPASEVLLDLADPNISMLFNYLTVIDPVRWFRAADETRVAGRININTAPAMVLAQLPWLRYEGGVDCNRPEDIVGYRVRDGQSHPYRSIADLMQIPSMRNLMGDALDNQFTDTPKGPDLTADTARDDMEERDLLFTRISDLVTVRSDVFTAYILVRIGVNGPQRRIVAIFDRSGVTSGADHVRLIAQQLVPDPR